MFTSVAFDEKQRCMDDMHACHVHECIWGKRPVGVNWIKSPYVYDVTWSWYSIRFTSEHVPRICPHMLMCRFCEYRSLVLSYEKTEKNKDDSKPKNAHNKPQKTSINMASCLLVMTYTFPKKHTAAKTLGILAWAFLPIHKHPWAFVWSKKNPQAFLSSKQNPGRI